MTDPVATAERAYGVAERVISGVRPDQLDGPTPCSEWDVRTLMNHLIGAHHLFSAVLNDQPVDLSAAPPDFASADPTGSFIAGSKALLEAWRTPGNLDKTLDLPRPGTPAPMLLGMHTMDNVVHAWDLARATGQSEDLDEDLANGILAQMQANDLPRGAYFGEAKQAPPGANATQRLAAFLGRTV